MTDRRPPDSPSRAPPPGGEGDAGGESGSADRHPDGAGDGARHRLNRLFNRISQRIAGFTARPVAFVLAIAGTLVWAASGPFVGYSEMWHLVFNTATSLITFLMVFILQNSQERGTRAIQAKLDDLILRISDADDDFVGAEELDDDELERMRKMIHDRARGRRDTADAQAGLRADLAPDD